MTRSAGFEAKLSIRGPYSFHIQLDAIRISTMTNDETLCLQPYSAHLVRFGRLIVNLFGFNRLQVGWSVNRTQDSLQPVSVLFVGCFFLLHRPGISV